MIVIPGRNKYVPDNSVFIILKFDTGAQLQKMLRREDFLVCKSTLDCIATQEGGKCDFFTKLT